MYKIMYKYPGLEWEEIDETDDEEDARFLLGEYKLAYRVGKLKIKKEN
jgi:hypothetical protein